MSVESIPFGGGHCCACSGVCNHIGGPFLCARHAGQRDLSPVPTVTVPQIQIQPPSIVPPWQVPDGFSYCGITDVGMRIYCCVRCGAAVFFPAIHDQAAHNDQAENIREGSQTGREEA